LTLPGNCGNSFTERKKGDRRVTAAGTTPLHKSTAGPVGSLSVALAHANRLLAGKPVLAAEQAAEILQAIPGQPVAMLILAVAKRRAGDAETARAQLLGLTRAHPEWASAHYELGLTFSVLGNASGALNALRRAVAIDPGMSHAWRALGDVLTLGGDTDEADAAYAEQIKTSVTNPILMEAAAALVDNRLAVAERMLKDYLMHAPTDVAAIRMLAEVAARIGRYGDSETLLRRCLELAPSFDAARHNYALVLHRQGKAAEALAQIDWLLGVDARDPGYRNLKAAVLSHVGDYAGTLSLYAGVLAEYPNQPKVWMSYGHALKTAGRTDEGIEAYRRSIAQLPSLGEAYWSLANLKTYRFDDAEIAAMRNQLTAEDLGEDDRLHFHFALGKALEDHGDHAASFAHYAEGNRIRHRQLGYQSAETHERVSRAMAVFTPELLERRSPDGCPAADPIFIVGLPRSGSTLIEQILSSHSAVEGTMELPDLGAIARDLGDKWRRRERATYPESLAELPPERLAELGALYLSRTRIQRKTDKPLFIDKTPQNFLHVGLIRLILPNAKIIDARRHPMAACFSVFKQHFARGQPFAYDLDGLGQYYRDYVALMAHFDRVAPGTIHRVIYEAMVDDTEVETRRLLDYCGLPFEDGCLQFYKNARAVRTASSEQVRRPIFREGLDQWRRYEPWLEPLKASLGDVLDRYPDAPAFTEA
jgi:tetratricopeptide (TPR) repeat protein